MTSKMPATLEDTEIAAILPRVDDLVSWAADLKEYALQQALSGTEFPDDLSPYAMVLHCGGCMLNEREVRYRMKCALDQGVPMTNYGVAIAHIHGILKRSISMFPHLLAEFPEDRGGAG